MKEILWGRIDPENPQKRINPENPQKRINLKEFEKKIYGFRLIPRKI